MGTARSISKTCSHVSGRLGTRMKHPGFDGNGSRILGAFWELQAHGNGSLGVGSLSISYVGSLGVGSLSVSYTGSFLKFLTYRGASTHFSIGR
jgi:hypothetical protein